jgi:rare lipoprotein A
MKTIILSLIFSCSLLAEEGVASWYEIKCNGGTHTASGIPLNNNAMTAAHKTLKMGTKVQVTSLDTGKSVTVTITDRGPYIKGRIIDLTKGAFSKIRNTHKGLTKVKIKILK